MLKKKKRFFWSSSLGTPDSQHFRRHGVKLHEHQKSWMWLDSEPQLNDLSDLITLFDMRFYLEPSVQWGPFVVGFCIQFPCGSRFNIFSPKEYTIKTLTREYKWYFKASLDSSAILTFLNGFYLEPSLIWRLCCRVLHAVPKERQSIR